jgi:hypothetical protein
MALLGGKPLVVVYLKNGEKAPMADANYVRLESTSETGMLMLRCFFGSSEVGQFKWDEVAGYAVEVIRFGEPQGSMEAWNQRLQA